MLTCDLDFRACEWTVRFVLLDFQAVSWNVSSFIFTTWFNYEMPLLYNCLRKLTYFFFSTNSLVKRMKNKNKTISLCNISRFWGFFPVVFTAWFGFGFFWLYYLLDRSFHGWVPSGLYSSLLACWRPPAVPGRQSRGGGGAALPCARHARCTRCRFVRWLLEASQSPLLWLGGPEQSLYFQSLHQLIRLMQMFNLVRGWSKHRSADTGDSPSVWRWVYNYRVCCHWSWVHRNLEVLVFCMSASKMHEICKDFLLQLQYLYFCPVYPDCQPFWNSIKTSECQ